MNGRQGIAVIHYSLFRFSLYIPFPFSHRDRSPLLAGKARKYTHANTPEETFFVEIQAGL